MPDDDRIEIVAEALHRARYYGAEAPEFSIIDNPLYYQDLQHAREFLAMLNAAAPWEPR